MDPSILEMIKTSFPRWDDKIIQELIPVLEKHGIVDISDFKYISYTDLTVVLNTVQAKKLLECFNRKSSVAVSCVLIVLLPGSPENVPVCMNATSIGGSPGTSGSHQGSLSMGKYWHLKILGMHAILLPGSPENAAISMSATSPTTSYPSTSSPAIQPASGFTIKWHLVPNKVMKVLDDNVKPCPRIRHEFVRALMNQVVAAVAKPSKVFLNNVAVTVVRRYPKAFEDQIGNDVIGSGTYSFLKSLMDRRDNLNRNPGVASRTAELASVEKKSKRKLSDSYGCINWQPPSNILPEELVEFQKQLKDSTDEATTKQLMEKCFTDQRELINAKASVSDIMDIYPKLCTMDGIFIHFELLVGKDCLQKLSDGIKAKGKLLVSYFTGHNYKNAEQMKGVTANTDILKSIIIMLMIHFGEDKDVMFPNSEVLFGCT